jgi:hypothetical protein
MMDPTVVHMLASPGGGHRAVRVLEFFGIGLAAIVFILLCILFFGWLAKLSRRDDDRAIKMLATVFLVPISLGVAADITGYIAGNVIFYIIGAILIGVPIMVGLIMAMN